MDRANARQGNPAPASPARPNAAASGADLDRSVGEEFEEIDRKIAHTGEVVASGFGMIASKLSIERQAKLDRQLDTLEAFGRGLKREGAAFEQGVAETMKDVEGAVGFFMDAVFEPEKFRERLGLDEIEADAQKRREADRLQARASARHVRRQEAERRERERLEDEDDE